MEVDVFDACEPEDCHDDVSEFLLICFVSLSAYIGGFSAMFGKVCSCHFSQFFNEAENKKRSVFLRVFHTSINAIKVGYVVPKGRIWLGAFSFHISIIYTIRKKR